MKNQFKFENFLLTIYSYLATAFLGWQILSFFGVYFQSNEKKIQISLSQWLDVQVVYLPIITICIIILITSLFLNKNIRSGKYILNRPALNKHLVYLLLLFAGIGINFVLSHKNILELVNLVLAILSLHQLSKLFFVQNKISWYHPTTQGGFYLSAGLLGISQILIFGVFSETSYSNLIIILLVIEAMRLTARFRFLSKFSKETNIIARSLLGRYGIYFGVRVVAGIFMPLAYTVYSMITNAELLRGVGALIIIGEFLERLLYIYISGSQEAKNDQLVG